MNFGNELQSRGDFGKRWIDCIVLVESGKLSRADLEHVSWCAMDIYEKKGEYRQKPAPTGNMPKDERARFDIETENLGNADWCDDLIRYQNEHGFDMTEFQTQLFSHLLYGKEMPEIPELELEDPAEAPF